MPLSAKYCWTGLVPLAQHALMYFGGTRSSTLLCIYKGAHMEAGRDSVLAVQLHGLERTFPQSCSLQCSSLIAPQRR